MPLDWRQVQNTLRDAFRAASGLSSVIWARQNAPQPARPYATLQVIAGPLRLGALDEENDVYQAGNAAGEEIEQTFKGQREFTLSCQVFADTTADAGTAYDYLSRAMSGLSLPSAQSLFVNVGLAVVSANGIQDLSALLETKWQSRAQMDVRFRIADSVVEKTGYIATVEPDPTWH